MTHFCLIDKPTNDWLQTHNSIHLPQQKNNQLTEWKKMPPNNHLYAPWTLNYYTCNPINERILWWAKERRTKPRHPPLISASIPHIPHPKKLGAVVKLISHSILSLESNKMHGALVIGRIWGREEGVEEKLTLAPRRAAARTHHARMLQHRMAASPWPSAVKLQNLEHIRSEPRKSKTQSGWEPRLGQTGGRQQRARCTRTRVGGLQ